MTHAYHMMETCRRLQTPESRQKFRLIVLAALLEKVKRVKTTGNNLLDRAMFPHTLMTTSSKAEQAFGVWFSFFDELFPSRLGPPDFNFLEHPEDAEVCLMMLCNLFPLKPRPDWITTEKLQSIEQDLTIRLFPFRLF